MNPAERIASEWLTAELRAAMPHIEADIARQETLMKWIRRRPQVAPNGKTWSVPVRIHRHCP